MPGSSAPPYTLTTINDLRVMRRRSDKSDEKPEHSPFVASVGFVTSSTGGSPGNREQSGKGATE
jgi:hypothetical protein